MQAGRAGMAVARRNEFVAAVSAECPLTVRRAGPACIAPCAVMGDFLL